MKDIMPKLEKAFGDWQKGDVPAATIPPAPAQSASRIFLIDRPGSVQTVLTGTLGIERTSPDYFAVLMADRVLGGGPSGRPELRETATPTARTAALEAPASAARGFRV